MEWVTVYTTNQFFESELVLGILESENIIVCDLNKKDSSYTNFGNIEIKVPLEQEQQAISILKQHQFL